MPFDGRKWKHFRRNSQWKAMFDVHTNYVCVHLNPRAYINRLGLNVSLSWWNRIWNRIEHFPFGNAFVAESKNSSFWILFLLRSQPISNEHSSKFIKHLVYPIHDISMPNKIFSFVHSKHTIGNMCICECWLLAFLMIAVNHLVLIAGLIFEWNMFSSLKKMS